MTTIEMIKNLAQRNRVVASADVLAVFAELEEVKAENMLFRETGEYLIKAASDAQQRAEEAEKRLPILEQDKLRLNEIINSEANRADEAEKRLATPVRLPTTSGRLGVAYTRVIPEVIEAIRAAGFTVDGEG